MFFAVAIAALVLAWFAAPRGYREELAALVAKEAPAQPVAAALPAPIPPAPVALAPSPAPEPKPLAAPPPPPAPAAPVEEDIAPPRRGRSPARVSPIVAKATRTRAPKAHRAAPAAPPPPTGPAPTSALASALREAAGPPTAPDPPADAPPAPVAHATTTGSDPRPERPSGSAVANAITHVLPAARACLGDVPDASRATITFGPEGAVDRVDLSGPAAASSKQGPCVRTALGRAHVPPFSQSSYTASVVVRPM
jgi:hypothetical protein